MVLSPLPIPTSALLAIPSASSAILPAPTAPPAFSRAATRLIFITRDVSHHVLVELSQLMPQTYARAVMENAACALVLLPASAALVPQETS